MFENLESRRYLTSVSLSEQGVLEIHGSSKADQMLFDQIQDRMRLRFNGTVRYFEYNAVKSINVDAAGGNDEVVIGVRRVPVTLLGGAGNDTLSGGNNNDYLSGGSGNDYLCGRGGDDTLIGGGGSDDIAGGADRDIVDYSARTQDLVIGVGTEFDDGAVGEKDNVRDDVEVVVGGSGNDEIRTRMPKPIEILGGPGNDTLLGFSASDTLYGNEGNDSLFGGSGNDLLADASNKSRHFGGVDTLNGGTGEDTVKTGSSGDQVLNAQTVVIGNYYDSNSMPADGIVIHATHPNDVYELSL
jgi:Ca2+-binding RTX toxin-like protein